MAALEVTCLVVKKAHTCVALSQSQESKCFLQEIVVLQTQVVVNNGGVRRKNFREVGFSSSFFFVQKMCFLFSLLLAFLVSLLGEAACWRSWSHGWPTPNPWTLGWKTKYWRKVREEVEVSFGFQNIQKTTNISKNSFFLESETGRGRKTFLRTHQIFVQMWPLVSLRTAAILQNFAKKKKEIFMSKRNEKLMCCVVIGLGRMWSSNQNRCGNLGKPWIDWMSQVRHRCDLLWFCRELKRHHNWGKEKNTL